jgi:hypothetical protein
MIVARADANAEIASRQNAGQACFLLAPGGTCIRATGERSRHVTIVHGQR